MAGESPSVAVGTIAGYWGTAQPDEKDGETWLLCDGADVDRKDFQALHALVGELFGPGDNWKTFNLPDLRGRFIRGLDYGPDPADPAKNTTSGRDPGLQARTAMADGTTVVGPQIGSLQPDAAQAHLHALFGWTWSRDEGNRNCSCFVPTVSVDAWGSTDNAGGSETRPRNSYVNFIIRAK